MVMKMESLWKDTVLLPRFPELEGDIRTDVLIIGGGLTGILCAWMLEQEGISYVLAEAGEICDGVTGNTTAKITSQHGLIYHKLIGQFGAEKTRMYYEANEKALERYRSLCREMDCDFEEIDNYVYSVDRHRKLEKEMDALRRLGIEADFVPSPQLPFETAGAVRFAHQARFNPLKFVCAIAGDLKIYEHTGIRSFDGKCFGYETICGAAGRDTARGRENGRHAWQSGRHGTITAKKVLTATHFPIWNKHGSYFLKLYQHRSYVLALENGPRLNGAYVDERKTGLSFRNYKNFLLLGGGAHRTGSSGKMQRWLSDSAWMLQGKGTGWEALEETARKLYPEAKIRYRWATQDCMSLDGVPYIGQYSKNTPDLFVASGYNKWGMTTAMAAAQILCDLVQDRKNPYTSVFSPSRTMLRPQLALNGAQSVLNLLTPTLPRCPHMGCALKWNRQEHTWDCPCHGSRFTEEGKLLDNPANENMK